jgi:hypothetical protein
VAFWRPPGSNSSMRMAANQPFVRESLSSSEKKLNVMNER